MNSRKNRRIVLAKRPLSEPSNEDFRMEEMDVPNVGEGELLLRTLYLSLDPYMRGRMSAAPSYARPVNIGETMVGGVVSEVVESKAAEFHSGDVVLAASGWQEYAVVPASSVEKLDSTTAPISSYLGVLGMPGMTAYVGLLNIGKPKPGETVVVAAATGPVGSVVGQIARLKGCRVVGVAGGPHKCDLVMKRFGFDTCLDHRSENFEQKLAAACPKGIDVYFENVGGRVWEAVIPLLNAFGRVPVCGTIAYSKALYNPASPPAGRDHLPSLMRTILTKRLTLQGFIVSDFAAQKNEFRRQMSDWVRNGAIKFCEDIAEGLENAVAAFLRMLQGGNVGKALVRITTAT